MVGASVKLSIIEGSMTVKEIISEDKVLIDISGHWGDEIIVTSDKEGEFSVADSFGYNDNFRAFSIKLTIKLVKK